MKAKMIGIHFIIFICCACCSSAGFGMLRVCRMDRPTIRIGSRLMPSTQKKPRSSTRESNGINMSGPARSSIQRNEAPRSVYSTRSAEKSEKKIGIWTSIIRLIFKSNFLANSKSR